MPDESNAISKIFRQAVARSVFVLLLVFIGVLYLLSRTPTLDKFLNDALVNVLSEFIAGAVIYLVAYAILGKANDLSRTQEIKKQVVDPILVSLDGSSGRILTALRDNNQTVRPKIADIDWAKLFEGTDEIFLLVQGWDKWKDKVADFLPSFLERGGKIHVILHDPEEKELLKRMSERMAPRTEQEVKAEIEKTLHGLTEVTKGRPNQFVHHYTKRMNWFCGIYFRSSNCKHGKLLLSVYQHQSAGEFAVNRVPSFLIRTDVFPDLGSWFDEEWKHLLADATPTTRT